MTQQSKPKTPSGALEKKKKNGKIATDARIKKTRPARLVYRFLAETETEAILEGHTWANSKREGENPGRGGKKTRGAPSS